MNCCWAPVAGHAPFGPAGTPTFDPAFAGGTTNLVFDTVNGQLIEDYASLTGTSRNCAGGFNPFGRSWITCEETNRDDGHGFIFEVPGSEAATAEPIMDAGRFAHEAVASDPESGIVYETEDAGISGFYRYIPDNK